MKGVFIMYDNNSGNNNNDRNADGRFSGNQSYNDTGNQTYQNSNENQSWQNGSGNQAWQNGSGNGGSYGNGNGNPWYSGSPYSGPYAGGNNPYGGNPFGGSGKRPDGDTAGKRVGRAVLSGVIAGLVGAGVICLAGSAVLPHVIDNSVDSAAEKIEKSIEDSWGSLPDFSQDGSGSSGDNSGSQRGGNSGEAPDDQDADSSSSSADGDTSSSSGAFLGVVCENIADMEDTDTSDYPEGVYVKEVSDGSPASLGSIKAGDIITAVDDTKVASFEELASVIANHKAGDSVTITLQRKTGSEWKESTHQVTLTEKPQQSSDSGSGSDLFGQMFGDQGDNGSDGSDGQ